MPTKDTGPKKFSVPTKARFLIDEQTKQVASFVYTTEEQESLNSFKNKIAPTELVLVKDEAICRVLYALSRKNNESKPRVDQLKDARLFILSWVQRREMLETIQAW